MSGTQNPEALPKYQWETLKGSGSQDGVTHVIHDPHDSSPTPGSSRSETWESYKQPIGSGGQGTVFLQGCTSGSRVGQCRALKVIHCREAKRQKQYLREIEAMAKFSNERLSGKSELFTKLFGYYLSMDRADICIAMEYQPEGDLHSYIRLHGPLHEQHAQEVLGQALQALTMLHEAGFPHGNMKPQNILIHQRPESDQPHRWWVKLADFGISRHIDTIMNPADRLGILDDCMAPDLWSLLEHQIQPTKLDLMGADMWALAAVAFFVLTAQEGGFKEWVSVARNADTCELLPKGQLVGQDALSFILNKTAKSPVDRLSLDTVWLARFTRPWSSTEPSRKDEVKDNDEKGDTVTVVASLMDDSSSSLAKYDRLAHLSHEEICGSKGREAVYAACQDGDVEMLRGLIHRGADVTSWDRLETRHPYARIYRGVKVGTPKDWESPLLRAARHGQISTVELLAKSGVQVTRPVGVDGLLAINEAARLGQSGVVTLLMNLGADPRAMDCFGYDALSCAAREGHLDVLKLMLLSSMMQKSPFSDENRAAALDEAACRGHQDVVLYLVDMGSDIFTALHEAAKRGRLDVVDSLVRVTPPNKRVMLLLQDVALMTEDWEMAEYLQNAMVDALTESGAAPSMVASPANEAPRPITVPRSRLLHGSPLDSGQLNTDGRGVIRIGCPFWIGGKPILHFHVPWEGATVDGVVNPKYVLLHNESSTLAAGGQLLISRSANHDTSSGSSSSSSCSLAIDLFQIAPVDGSGGNGKAYALHPRYPASSDENMLFSYSLSSQSAGMPGHERWVWEQVPPSRCQRRQDTASDGSLTRQYLLYISTLPIPTLARQPIRFGGAIILGRFLKNNGWFTCYARLQVSGGHQHKSKSSGHFRLDVMRPGGDNPWGQQAYLAIVITALAIWARYVDEPVTAHHVQGCWPWP